MNIQLTVTVWSTCDGRVVSLAAWLSGDDVTHVVDRESIYTIPSVG